MPKWVIPAFIFFALMGVFNAIYIVDKCGAKGLLLGNSANTAVMAGFCDNKENSK